MAKEYTWKLPTENGEKEVTCEVDGNKYHLYVGDAFVKTVFKNMSGGADVELTIAGVPCRFVSFSDKPDLVVDGIMLGSGKSYETEKKADGKNAATFAIFEIVIGLIALVAFIAWSVANDSFRSYLPSFLIPIVFIIFGAVELYNINKKK
jgi:hypothetical protein